MNIGLTILPLIVRAISMRFILLIGFGIMISLPAFSQNDTTESKPDTVQINSFKNRFKSSLEDDQKKRDSIQNRRVEESEKEDIGYIALQAKQYPDSIVIRWAPSNRLLWLMGKDYGYVLVKRTSERRSFEDIQDLSTKVLKRLEEKGIKAPDMSDPATLPSENELRAFQAEIEKLTREDPEVFSDILSAPVDEFLASYEDPIKPYDSATWAPYFPTEDSYALLAAGVVHGALEISPDVGFALKGKQENSVFGMTLISADLSRLAANGLGLRFVDTDVEKGKNYSYTVYIADSLSQVPFENLSEEERRKRTYRTVNQDPTGTSILEYEGIMEVKEVVGLATQSLDHEIQLHWPVKASPFTGFLIERSQDGGETFDLLTQRPFMGSTFDKVMDTLGTLEEHYRFRDSVEYNYLTYTYRVRGIDAFADESKPSLIEGMAIDQIDPTVPHMKKAEFNEESGSIRVVWEYPEIPSDFESMSIQYGFFADGEYSEIKPLKKEDTVYVHQVQPLEYAHYFRIAVIDTNGRKAYSDHIFTHVPDTVRPIKVTGLKASIDSGGIVDLNWDKSHEDDKTFKGYRVYYANARNHEFTQLTTKAIRANTFTYQIPLDNLTETIYYKVQAVDQSFNLSQFSEIVEAKKPDTIPPVAPVFHTPVISETEIILDWEPSSSRDVVANHLVRVETGGDTLVRILEDISQTTFSDIEVEKGKNYNYTMFAVDDDGMMSDPSFPVGGKLVDNKRLQPVEDLQVKYNKNSHEIRLTWKSDIKDDDVRYVVYRNLNDDKVKRYNMVEDQSFRETLKKKGTYYYAVRVVKRDGSKSILSKAVPVKAE